METSNLPNKELKNESESICCSVISDSLQPHGLWSTRLLCPWNSSGKNTGVGCYSLLQKIFTTQGLKPHLLHCRQNFLSSEPPGKSQKMTTKMLSELKSLDEYSEKFHKEKIERQIKDN